MTTHLKGAVRRYVSKSVGYMTVIRPACGVKGFGPFKYSDHPTCSWCSSGERKLSIDKNIERLSQVTQS